MIVANERIGMEMESKRVKNKFIQFYLILTVISITNIQIRMQISPEATIQTHTQLAPSLQAESLSSIQQDSVQIQSETDTSPVGSNSKSDNSLQEISSQDSTEPDVQMGYASLRSIKSKEEIQLESRENEEMLTNLNFNIDDLFRKISSLTDQITTELHPRLFQQRTSPRKSSSLINLDLPAESITELTQSQQQPQTASSASPTRSPLTQSPEPKPYKPIFFQPYRPTTPQHSINMKLFQTGKSLGCGKFGQVVQCRNVKTGVLYALKKIFKSVIDEYRMEDQLLTELQILKQIDHPNIVKAYEAFTDDFHIFILMEYIHGPLLVQRLKCSESECKVIMRQVLEALKYLHEKKITHRDIKPQNIILTGENVVKICDFGWAAQGQEKMEILCGTLDYVSPEMAREQAYSEKGDLWNVGVLAYELIQGYAPFRGSSKSRIFEKVRKLEYSFSQEIEMSEECKEFIRGYLRQESARESIEWGLNHEFLRIKQEDNKEQNEKERQQEQKELVDKELQREFDQLMQE